VALTTVLLSGTYVDGQENPLAGTVTFTPSVALADGTDNKAVRQRPVTATLDGSGAFSLSLLSTDNGSLLPSGWYWTIREAFAGTPARQWNFNLLHATGASQDISDLEPVVSVAAASQYLPLGGGTMTGFPVLPGDPTVSLQAAPKQYVDEETTRALAAEAALGAGGVTAGTGLTKTGSTLALTIPVTIADGGTGQASAQSAMDALAGSVTSGTVLRGNGTHAVMGTIQAADVPTLNQNTTGTAADLSATLSIAHGGTAATTAQAAINALAGGVTSGSFMRGNGTNVVLSPIQAADVPALLTDTAVKTSAYTAVAGDNVLVSTSGAAVTITTPATPLNKQMFGVKHVIQGLTAGVPNAVGGAANAGVTFNDDASTTFSLPMVNQSAVYQFDSALTAWVKIYGDTPVGGLDIRYGAAIAALATAGATPAITANTAGTWNVTLSANVTGLTIAGATATPSQVLTLNIAQPASGGPFTFPGGSWPGSVTWLAGTAPVIASAASAVTVVTLRTANGGTTWYGSASAVLPVTGGGTGAATASAALAALGAAPLAGATFTGPVAPAVVALTDSTTITVAATAGNDFRLTLTASGHTLGSPSGGVDGQEIIVQITQGTGGGFTLAYGTGYEFSAQLPAPVLSVTAGQVDVLKFLYNAAKGKFFFVAFLGGF
jgi:hypothetical protein